MVDSGTKHDAGKLRYSLLPWRGLDEVVRVLEHGVTKYGEGNWRKVPDARRRYLDAALRHIRVVLDDVGEDHDRESRLPHLAHAVCSLLFVLELDEELAVAVATMNLPDPAEPRVEHRPLPCRCGHARADHLKGLRACSVAFEGVGGKSLCDCVAFESAP